MGDDLCPFWTWRHIDFYGFGQVIMLYRQSEIVFDVVFVSDGVYSLEHLFLYIVDKGLNMNLVRVLCCVVAFNC